MKSIAISNRKGGVGKTTLTGNLSYFISTKKNKKTLIVDCDSQGSLTKSMIEENTLTKELTDLLSEKCPPAKTLTQIGNNLVLLPTFSSSNKLKDFSENKASSNPLVFKKLIKTFDKFFDYIIFDLSPAINSFEKSVISACDEVIVPLLPETLSVDGVKMLENEIPNIKNGYMSEVKIKNIIINNANMSMKTHKIYTNQIISSLSKKYNIIIIPQYSKFKDQQVLKKSIFQIEQKDKNKKYNEVYKSFEDLYSVI